MHAKSKPAPGDIAALRRRAAKIASDVVAADGQVTRALIEGTDTAAARTYASDLRREAAEASAALERAIAEHEAEVIARREARADELARTAAERLRTQIERLAPPAAPQERTL
jgi:cell division septum initiation protein DivIVA